MFKAVLSEYMTANMSSRSWKLKDMARESGLSDSTLNSYILQKTGNPVEENVLRIIAAFSDPPEMLAELRRRAAHWPAGAEKRLLENADDKERMEQYAQIVRTNVAQLLEEYRLQSAAQQTEIIQHADKRVEDLKEENKSKCKEIAEQCREHEREYKAHCDALIEAERRAFAAELKGSADMIQRLEKNIEYLRTIVRNLSIVAALLGAYSVYAYKTFDVNDPSQGLYQGIGATNLPLIVMFVVLMYAALSIGKSMLAKKLSTSDKPTK